MNSDKRAEREQHRAWLRECIARCRAEVARYEKAVERRPNTYRPRLAEAQHTLGKFYWWRHTPASYRTAFRLFTQALRNYDSYRGRRDLTLNRLTLMSDLQQLSLRLDDDRAEEVLLGLLSAYESMAAAAPLVYGEDVASTFWQLGNLHADARRFGEAERMYLRALDKHAEFDGEDPHRYGTVPTIAGTTLRGDARRCPRRRGLPRIGRHTARTVRRSLRTVQPSSFAGPYPHVAGRPLRTAGRLRRSGPIPHRSGGVGGRTRSMTGSERWRRPASITDAGHRWFSAETGLSLRSRAVSCP